MSTSATSGLAQGWFDPSVPREGPRAAEPQSALPPASAADLHGRAAPLPALPPIEPPRAPTFGQSELGALSDAGSGLPTPLADDMSSGPPALAQAGAQAQAGSEAQTASEAQARSESQASGRSSTPVLGIAADVVSAGQARWRLLAERLAVEAEAVPLPEGAGRAAMLHLELGRLYEERLGDVRRAANAYQQAFYLDPQNRAVLRAARRLFVHVDNAAMVEQLLRAEADATHEPRRRAQLLVERAAWLEDRLGQPEAALAGYREALELWPEEGTALAAIEEILATRGAHVELAAHYTRLLTLVSQGPGRAPILWAAARLADDQLGDAAQAIERLEQLLEIVPRHREALARLRRLYAEQGRDDALAQVLVRSIDAALDEVEATDFAIAAARVEHGRLGRVDRAIGILGAALERSPGSLRVLVELERLHAQESRPEDLARVLRAQLARVDVPAERAEVSFRLAQVLDEQLGRADEAVTALEDVLRDAPVHVAATQALGRAYERLGRFEPLAGLFTRELERVTDPMQRAARLFKLAELLTTKLSRTGDAIARLEELLALSPAYAPARRLLEALYRDEARWGALQALYAQELELTDDVEQKIFVLGRVAELRELKLQDLDGAAAALAQVLTLRPGHLEALRSLARLEERRERWSEVLRCLELEAEATSDQSQVVALMHRAGTIEEERLRDLPRAIATYEKVLALSPGYLPALRSLGRLYARERRWDELVTMYRREIDIARSPEQELGLLHRIAELYVHRVRDDARAADVYREILAREPRSLAALVALESVVARLGRHEELREVLERRLALAEPPAARAALLTRLAEVEERALARPARALELHLEALALAASAAGLDAVRRLARSLDRPEALEAALLSAVERTEPTSARAELHAERADVLARRGPREPTVVAALEAAPAEGPISTDVGARLARAYAERRDLPRSLAMSIEVAGRSAEATLRAGVRLRSALRAEAEPELAARVGQVHLDVLADQPDHVTATRAVELAYLRSQQRAGLLALYRREAMTTGDRAERIALAVRAAELAEADQEDPATAIELLRLALATEPTHLPAILALRGIAERLGDTRLLLECTTLEASATGDPSRRLEILRERGVLLEELGDRASAAQAFRALLAERPDDVSAFRRLERLYVGPEHAASLAALLEARASAIDTVDEQAELLARAGEVALDALREPARARSAFAAALARRPMHPRALERVGPLLVEAGEHGAAIEVFHKLVTVAPDPMVRAQGFRALGRLYEEQRQDLVKAVQAYQAAVQADPQDVDSLERLARVYRDAEDWTSSVNVLLRLAEVEPRPRAKVQVLLELAGIYEHAFGDLASAVLAHEKALEVEPGDTAAMLRLAELHERTGNWRALGEQADAFVRALPVEERGRAVPLLLRVADAFEQRVGDDARAIMELRVAQSIDPARPEVIEALARVYAKHPDTWPLAIDCHRQLLRQDPFRTDSYHQMRRLFERQGELDKAFVVCEVLVFLRAARQDEDLFFQEHKVRVPSFAARALTREEHEGYVVHPDERGVARLVLEILGADAGKAFPGDLTAYELNPRTDRFAARAEHPVRRIADGLAEILGAPTFDLWITKKYELGLFVENGEPPAIIVGAGLPRRVQERELRFLMARQLERLKSAQQLLLRLPPRELELVVLGAARLVRPELRFDRDAAELDAASKRVARALSRRGRKVLEDLGPQLAQLRLDVERQRQASVLTALRAGFALTNDVEVVARSLAREVGLRAVFADAVGAREALGGSPEMRHLLSFAVSEEYFELRRRLQFSIQS